MRKHALFLACLALLVVLLEVPSQASNMLRARANTPILTISDTEARCSVNYNGKRTDSISVTLTLKQGSTTVASWNADGTQFVSISESCTVKPGKTYTLVMTSYINGVRQPSISVAAKS